MEDGTITVRLVHSTHQRPKHMLFEWRKALYDSPKLFKNYKSCLGVYIITHFLIAFLFYFVISMQIGSSEESLEYPLYILFFLTFQLQILCFLMIGVIISDLMNNALNLAVWQRSAIGRTLRNTFVLLMILLFVLFCITQSEYLDNEIKYNDFASASSPLVILLVISLMKMLCIKGENSLIWVGICVLIVVELALVILKIDFGAEIKTVWVYLPLSSICCLFSLTYFSNFTDRLVQNLAGVMVCLNFATYLTIRSLELDGLIERNYYYRVTPFVGFTLIYWFFSSEVGMFVHDILFGHLETDFYYFVNPPVKSGIRACTT